MGSAITVSVSTRCAGFRTNERLLTINTSIGNAYGVFFPFLASRGIQVHAFDQRGWGQSVSESWEKGLTGPTAQVLADISSFLRPLIPSPVPLFLCGHSMGGAEVLHYAASGPSEIRDHIRGYAVFAPFVAVAPDVRPWGITVKLGRLASKMMPKKQMVNKLAPELLTRDPAVQQEFAEDTLCHDTGTLEGLAGMLDRAIELEDGIVAIGEGKGEGGKTRLWVGHGTADRVCSYEATKWWYDLEHIKDKTFKTYDGWYHALHREPEEDKFTFANDMADWILSKCQERGDSKL
jgi:acylglycerol lipase